MVDAEPSAQSNPASHTTLTSGVVWLAGAGTLKTAAVLLTAWALIFSATSLAVPSFLSRQTLVVVAFNTAFIGTMAVGQSLVMKSGGELDLSIGVTAAASALIAGSILSAGMSTSIMLVVCLGFGAVIGTVNALLVVRLGVHPIVATLGMLFLITGISRLSTNFVVIPRGAFIRDHLGTSTLGIPNVFLLMLVLLLITEFILERTRPGRHLVAVGGNLEAALNRGIHPPRIQATSFVLCGVTAALAGIVLAAQVDIVEAQLAVGTEFRVISALLLGGIALTGGRGRLLGLLASLWLLATIPTAIVSLGISASWQPVVEGLILAVALAIDSARHGKRSSQ